MRKVTMRSKKGLTVTEAFENFMRKCTVRNLSLDTIDSYKIRLRVFQQFLNKETYLDEELKALLKKPNLKSCDFTEYKICVMTNYLIATGNRISSILNLKISDLDFDNALILKKN